MQHLKSLILATKIHFWLFPRVLLRIFVITVEDKMLRVMDTRECLIQT